MEQQTYSRFFAFGFMAVFIFLAFVPESPGYFDGASQRTAPESQMGDPAISPPTVFWVKKEDKYGRSKDLEFSRYVEFDRLRKKSNTVLLSQFGPIGVKQVVDALQISYDSTSVLDSDSYKLLDTLNLQANHSLHLLWDVEVDVVEIYQVPLSSWDIKDDNPPQFSSFGSGVSELKLTKCGPLYFQLMKNRWDNGGLPFMQIWANTGCPYVK